MMKNIKRSTRLIALILTGVMMIMFNSCKDSSENKYADVQHPIATIEVEDFGTITVELYPDVAPASVCNFVTLANSGFYDGLIFHRVIPGFMIQGGDPDGVGTGGPGYTIKGEFSINGHENSISHEAGVISMARNNLSYDSAGSQFFICVADSTHLDTQYAAFGRTTSGLDVAIAISAVSRNSNDKPDSNVVIKSIRVETFGVDYSDYEKLQ